MKSYYRNPTATASTITPTGFLRTGDLGLIRDGFVYQLDRAKDMIIRAGENVYSVEVENRVLEVQGVEEVTVVGVPHPRLGEEVACIVTLKPGAKVTGQDIIKHCRSKMAAFKCPSYVHFKPEGLPKNATGKVLKREVKEEVVALLKAGKLGVGLPPAAPKL